MVTVRCRPFKKWCRMRTVWKRSLFVETWKSPWALENETDRGIRRWLDSSDWLLWIILLTHSLYAIAQYKNLYINFEPNRISFQPASARGIGIKVVHKLNQIPRKRNIIIQKYLASPYLINGRKFDLRIYVYVSSYDPLCIYIYDNGLVRFASSKWVRFMNKFVVISLYMFNIFSYIYECWFDRVKDSFKGSM